MLFFTGAYTGYVEPEVSVTVWAGEAPTTRSARPLVDISFVYTQGVWQLANNAAQSIARTLHLLFPEPCAFVFNLAISASSQFLVG